MSTKKRIEKMLKKSVAILNAGKENRMKKQHENWYGKNYEWLDIHFQCYGNVQTVFLTPIFDREQRNKYRVLVR